MGVALCDPGASTHYHIKLFLRTYNIRYIALWLPHWWLKMHLMKHLSYLPVAFSILGHQASCAQQQDCSKSSNTNDFNNCVDGYATLCKGMTLDQFKKGCCPNGKPSGAKGCEFQAPVGGCGSVAPDQYAGCVSKNTPGCENIKPNRYTECCVRRNNKYQLSDSDSCKDASGKNWFNSWPFPKDMA